MKNRGNQTTKSQDLSSNVLIITLNVNGLNNSVKNRTLQSRFKNMTKLYVICKKLTSNIIIYANWIERMKKDTVCKD